MQIRQANYYRYWLIWLLLMSPSAFSITYIAKSDENRISAISGLHTLKVFRNQPFVYRWAFDCRDDLDLSQATDSKIAGTATGTWFANPSTSIDINLPGRCNRLKVFIYELDDFIVYKWSIRAMSNWELLWSR